jgi:hypothetical protein
MVDWTAVSALVSAGALLVNLVVAYSLIISMRALREAQGAKESAIFIWALDRIREVRPLMREIKKNSTSVEWPRANQEKVLEVLSVMQMISFMAQEGIIERQKIVDMWGKTIVEQWIYLEPFIREFRTRIGESETADGGAYYARSFEQVAAYARKDLSARFVVRWPGA